MLGHAMRARLNQLQGGWQIGCLAFVLAIGLAGAARADEVDDLRQELEQLKQQVLYLQNQIPGASAGASGGGGNLAAQQQLQATQFQQQLTELTGQERVQEVARMLGGAQVTEKALAHAREMLSSPALNTGDTARMQALPQA